MNFKGFGVDSHEGVVDMGEDIGGEISYLVLSSIDTPIGEVTHTHFICDGGFVGGEGGFGLHYDRIGYVFL